MSWSLARSLRAAFDEANRLYPARSKASDGTIGDQAHASRTSDHNPCADHRIVHAGDFTHDPRAGLDVHTWLRRLAAHGDPRVRYLITNGQIWNPTSEAWNTYTRLRAEGHSRRDSARMAVPGWRTYTGSNPHDRHGHISVKHFDAARNDTSSWFYDDATPITPQEVKAMFPNHRFVRIEGEDRRFYSWDPADSSVYAWNGAPGPILSEQGQAKARAAGGIRDLAWVPGVGLSAVVGNPGQSASWPVWNFKDLGAEDRA